LKTSSDGDSAASLGNVVLDCSHREKGSPYIQSLLFQLMPVVSHPLATHSCEKPSSIFLMTDLVGTGRLLLTLLEALSSPG